MAHLLLAGRERNLIRSKKKTETEEGTEIESAIATGRGKGKKREKRIENIESVKEKGTRTGRSMTEVVAAPDTTGMTTMTTAGLKITGGSVIEMTEIGMGISHPDTETMTEGAIAGVRVREPSITEETGTVRRRKSAIGVRLCTETTPRRRETGMVAVTKTERKR
jgi:hypothetical protein